MPTRLVSVVLLLACALAGSATAGDAPPRKVEERILRETLAALSAREAATRLRALRDLGGLVSIDPSVGLAALPRLKAILRLRGPVERARVLELLVRIPHEDARTLWLARLDPEVESHHVPLLAAVRATRQLPADRELLRMLLTAVRAKRATPARRALLLEALGPLESPAVELLLTRPRAGEHWVEASARALALGRRISVRSVPPLLALLEHEQLAPRIHAWESLVRLTHRAFLADAKRWKTWWGERARSKLPAKPSPPKAGERYAAPRPTHVPHYYDLPIPRPGSNVVFCLDASQSMYGDGIDQARRELGRTLMDMPSTHAFEIIVFNEKVMPWAGRLVPAHPVLKHRAIERLAQIEPTSYTNLYGAVEMAFRYAGRGAQRLDEAPVKLDAIFLLSDGAPNRGQYRNDERIVKHIGRMSRRDIPVNTIGAGEEVFPLLRAIANATGGSFVDAFE
ncbi:MAG: VWA domain-containing protein [Planctomycetota bacterium]|nr:VWA domain-containing protein [Planctomycetota bacterium]